MILGMDFGTTNTGAAVFDGQQVNVLPIDPSSATPTSCRSAIYITRSRDYYLGSAALNTYFSQNVGRPSRYRKIKIGEIAQVFAELPTFYRDVFVYEDEYSPGRLFVSIKTALRNRHYFGTVYQDTWYSASDLVAIFLTGMKQRVERQLGYAVDHVVLGRPVHFSADPEEDQIAQNRLLEAAFKAGFKTVYLEYEPVAAALSYERQVQDKQLILVFDFGGGTLDFTIMEVGNPGRRQILATGGIPIAGDVFDQRLFRAAIPKHLGENDYFVSNGAQYPIPAHIFDLLSTPHEILSLNTPQNMEMLRSIHQGALHKEKTGALLQIVSSNYALLLFDQVERLKRQLSTQTDATLSFQAGRYLIEETVTRPRFERAIRREYEAIRTELERTLERAGVKTQDIDCVIRTGGSSQVPLFVRMLHHMFGYNRVREIDIFSSVTSGLALRGYEIATGQVELPVFHADRAGFHESIQTKEDPIHGPDEVDINEVRQRLEVMRDIHVGQASLPAAVLLFLDHQGSLSVYTAQKHYTPGDKVTTDKLPERVQGQAIIAALDRQILFATNQVRLFSLPARSLYTASQVGQQAVNDLLPLEKGEFVTAAACWQPDKVTSGWVYMVTTHGQVRSFDARLLAEQLLQKPYFQSERKYTGFPAVLCCTRDGTGLIAATNRGRLVCALQKEIGVSVFDILKVHKNEVISAAATFSEEDELYAVDRSGRLLSIDVETLCKGGIKERVRSLQRSFSIIALPAARDLQDENYFALTAHGILLRAHLPAGPLPFRLSQPYHAFPARDEITACLHIT